MRTSKRTVDQVSGPCDMWVVRVRVLVIELNESGGCLEGAVSPECHGSCRCPALPRRRRFVHSKNAKAIALHANLKRHIMRSAVKVVTQVNSYHAVFVSGAGVLFFLGWLRGRAGK